MNNNHQNIEPQDLSGDEGGLDFKKLIYIFLQYWPWFLATIFLALLTVFIYLRYTTPTYNIHSKILIKDDKSGSTGSSGDLLSELDIFNTTNNVNDEKEVLQTYFMVRKVIDVLQLNINYFIVGNIKSTELYKNSPFKIQLISLTDSIAAQTFSLKFSNNNSAFTIKGDSLNAHYKLNDTVKTNMVSFVVRSTGVHAIQNNEYKVIINAPTTVTQNYLQTLLSFSIDDKLANVITITLQETVPQRGEDILNKLYEVYTRMNEEDKNKISDSTISFIDERLAIVSDQLSGVEKNIEEFKIKNQLSTDMEDQAKLVLNNVSDVQKLITQQEVQINVVQAIEDHLKQGGAKVVPNAGVIEDPTYIATVQQYNNLVLARDRQLETTRPDNPVIKSLDDQIEGVKTNLLISLHNIINQLQIAKNELEGKNSQLMGEINSAPQKERVFLDISRQQDVKQQLYLYLLQKREETAISKSGTLANSRLIEPGKSDPLPFTPKRSLLYLVAFGIGILLPSGCIYLKNLLNNKVTDRSIIDREAKAPVLGEIGHNSTGRQIIAEQNSRTALAEQFRALRTNLQFVLKGKEQQVVMITSSASGEGKSFSTINLGLSLAISNKKVVLVELDLRKPKISKIIGLSNETGFTDYLISKFNKEEIVKSTPIHDNLFLISSGAIPPNPAELLLNTKVDELFSWLRTKFDYIIVDTPPAGIVVDPILIGKHADASVYIVRLGYTLQPQLKIINNFKQNEKIPNLSILINDVKLNRIYGYKYGYSNGYGYNYSSDYYTDEKKQKWKFLKKANRS